MALNNGIQYVLMVEYFIINALPIINMTKKYVQMQQKQVIHEGICLTKKYVKEDQFLLHATYVLTD